MHISIIIIVTVTASFASAIGVNLQKWSMNKEVLKDADHRRHPVVQPLWILGLGLQIIKAVGDFVFVGMAPVALLAPLGSLSLGFNLFLAPIFHPGEVASWRVWMATAWIYLGVTLTVVFAPRTDPDYDLDRLMELLKSIPFWCYVAFCTTFVAGLCHHGRRNGYSRLYYCGLAACFGGWNIIFAKGVSELLQNSITNKDPTDWISHPLPYVFIVGLVGTVVTGLTFLNLGLAKFESLVVFPVYQSLWTMFTITGSLIYYQEYQYMTAVDGIVYGLGIAVILLGVTLLVRVRVKEIVEVVSEDKDDLGVDLEAEEEGVITLTNDVKDCEDADAKSDVYPPTCESIEVGYDESLEDAEAAQLDEEHPK